MERIRNAVFGILMLALGLRVAWTLLQPALPALVVLAFLLTIFYMVLGRRG